MAADFQLWGAFKRLLPGRSGDDGAAAAKFPTFTPTNEMKVLQSLMTKHQMADDGSAFAIFNNTPGTVLAYSIQTTFVDTTPFLYIANGDPAKAMNIDQIKIIVTTAPASTTSAHYAIKTDQTARTLSTDNTTGTGANALAVNCPRSGVQPSNITARAQNSATNSILTAASTNAKIVARGSLGSIPVVGDSLIIAPGAVDLAPWPGLTAAQATCAGRKVDVTAPIVVDPGHNMTMHLWFIGNAATGLSYEIEILGSMR